MSGLIYPEHQSIFGDTYHGVQNPDVPHTHPYPTRYHGPNYKIPRFSLPFQPTPWQVAPILDKNNIVHGGKLGGSRFFYGAIKPRFKSAEIAPKPHWRTSQRLNGIGGVIDSPIAASPTEALLGKASLLGDLVLGAAAGYYLAPRSDDRPTYAVMGGAMVGMFGWLGLGFFAAAAYYDKERHKPKTARANRRRRRQLSQRSR